jgi:DNA-binding beta-propeller fold protein YncE
MLGLAVVGLLGVSGAASARTELFLEDGELRRFSPEAVVPLRKRPHRPSLAGGSVAVDGRSGQVFVADSDNDALAVADGSGKRVLRVVDCGAGSAPEQVVVDPEGRAYVSLRGSGELAVVEPGASRVGARLALGGEPFGLALAADGKTLFVSLARAAEVVALELPGLEPRLRVPVDAEPRGLAAAPDGDKLFVAHLTGRSVSVIDLETVVAQRERAVRRIALPGGSRSGDRLPNLTFAIALSPSGRTLYAPHVLEDTGQGIAPEVREGGYGAGAFEPIVATVTSIDAEAEELLGDRNGNARALRGRSAMFSLSQPRAVALDPVRSRLFVAGLGSDDVRVLNTATRDPMGLAPVEALHVAGGPKGLAVSADGARLYVHASLTHRLAVYDVHPTRGPRSRLLATLTVGGEKLPPEAVHGRALFFTARDARISRGGQFACASCHPEGRQDGMVWRLDKGPRQTPILAGRLVGTEPYNWLGTKGSLQDNMKETMGRLGGVGLPARDLDDLELYLTRYLPAPPAHAAPLSAEAEHGKALFESDEVGCAHCHQPGARFSDARTTTSAPPPTRRWRGCWSRWASRRRERPDRRATRGPSQGAC